MNDEDLNADIFTNIVKFLADITGRTRQSFSQTTDISGEALLDSIQVIQFFFFLEDLYTISIDIEPLTRRACIADVILAVAGAISAKTAKEDDCAKNM